MADLDKNKKTTNSVSRSGKNGASSDAKSAKRSAKGSNAASAASKTSKDDIKQRVKKLDDKSSGKKKAFIIGNSFMATLMVVYFIVIGIIGIWGISQFFWFYVQEKSPVMAAGTPASRVEGKPNIETGKMKAAKDAIMASGQPIAKVEINQVGPSIHFVITANEDVDVPTARGMSNTVLKTFADTIGQPEVFTKYEAQITVTKDSVEQPDEAVLLRPASEDGEERAFPQYGVSNKSTNKTENEGEFVYNISWSRNG